MGWLSCEFTADSRAVKWGVALKEVPGHLSVCLSAAASIHPLTLVLERSPLGLESLRRFCIECSAVMKCLKCNSQDVLHYKVVLK